MRKITLGWIVVGWLASMILGGCAPKHGDSVSFMVFGDAAELKAYQALVSAFHEKHAGIEIELRHVPSQGDYQKQLVTAFSAGAQPDVMLLNHRRVAQFAVQGGLEPLSSYLEVSQTLSAEDFYEQALSAFEWNGQTWCVPQNISSLVVYYNRTLFNAAGLAYPSSGWDWDDFLDTAHNLTKDLDGDGTIDQYGIGMDPGLMRFAPFIWQNGGELVNDVSSPSRLVLNSPQAMEAIQWVVDLQVKEKVMPDLIAEQAQPSEDRFMNGSLGMYLNSRRGVTTYRTIEELDWDVTGLPQEKNAVGILHSDGYCMSAKAKQKAAAWTFIEFANSIEGQTLMAATGRTVPSLKKVAESEAFLDPKQRPANSQIFLEVIPTLRQMPNLAGWPQIEEICNNEIKRALYGQASVEEAITNAILQTEVLFGR